MSKQQLEDLKQLIDAKQVNIQEKVSEAEQTSNGCIGCQCMQRI